MLGQTSGDSGVSGAPILSSGDSSASPVGGYTITAALGTLAAQNYTFSFASGTLSVMPATLIVTANPASRTYGAADPTYTASYSGFVLGQALGDSGVSGAPILSSSDNSVSPAGTYTITVALGSLGARNYRFTLVDGTLTLTAVRPTISWPDPADIAYGMPLGPTQLDATASVPGSFVYTPPAGTVLPAGAGQTLSLAFVPADTLDYKAASASVAISVVRVMPTIIGTSPADITFSTFGFADGTPLVQASATPTPASIQTATFPTFSQAAAP